MAISKERKNEVLEQYAQWIRESRALFLTEYTGLSVKQLDDLRKKAREAGGEFHIVKNTLGMLAFQKEGLPMTENLFEGSTAIGFAFKDAPPMAKTLDEFARDSEFLKLKGGYLGDKLISAAEVAALAELPPLPVMRARLLGTIMAPATQLARVLSEPARQVASVLKAYADSEADASAA